MTERSTSSVSILAALVVAVAGLLPLAWVLTAPEQSPPEDMVVVTSTTSPVPSTVVMVEPVPELAVDELDPAVVRVLQANGYAESLGRTEVGPDLPEAVTRLLIDRGAVLTVVEDAPSTEGTDS